jgi:hypothetical protein
VEPNAAAVTKSAAATLAVQQTLLVAAASAVRKDMCAVLLKPVSSIRRRPSRGQ